MEGTNPASELRQLFEKYLQKSCSETEIKQLVAYSQDDTLRPVFASLLSDMEAEEIFHETLINKVYMQVLPARKRPSQRWWAAAAAAVLLGAGTWLWYALSSPPKQEMTVLHTYDVQPGGNKAMLTLSDGTVIALDSAGNQLIRPGIRNEKGQLQYDETVTISYNTLTTPRGGQFQVRLPDGTRVWLNAASSLKYPTAFKAKERLVEVTGEAYFEVAKNAAMPFKVNVNNTAVEVLGTSFNVNAYTDEPVISTTLLEGSIRINGTVLKPGQQLSGGKLLSGVNIEKVVAWKNGLFNFEGAKLEEVMRQIMRWYNITVVYEKGIPDIEFVGEVSRNVTLTDLLDGLKGIGVRFRLEPNKRLVVMP